MNEDLLGDQDAELSIIGGLLSDNSVLDGCSLAEADFTSPTIGKVFASAKAEIDKGETMDLVRLPYLMERKGIEAPGLLGSIPIERRGAFDFYAKRVLEFARRRRAVALAAELTEGAKAVLTPIEETLEKAGAGLSTLAVDGAAKKRAFQLTRLGEIEVVQPDWLVRDYIVAGELSCIFGQPSTYKSFLAIDLAACIATGSPFHGHDVKQGPVVYLCGEGRSGIRKRFRAWEIVNDVSLEQAPIFISQQPTDLIDETAQRKLIEAVRKAARAVGAPVMIVVDTLSRNTSGDENSTQDMGEVVAACDRLRALFGCTVELVHHSGIADQGRGRGSSVIPGALDSQYCMSKDAGNISRLEWTKPPKDSEPPEPMAFQLAIVELGIVDDRGRPVTSCVLDSIDYVPAAKESHTSGMGRNQQTVLRILAELTEHQQQTLVNGGLDPICAVVRADDWEAACKKQGIPRNRFAEARKALVEKGALALESVYVRAL